MSNERAKTWAALWDAIDAYVVACGGSVALSTITPARNEKRDGVEAAVLEHARALEADRIASLEAEVLRLRGLVEMPSLEEFAQRVRAIDVAIAKSKASAPTGGQGAADTRKRARCGHVAYRDHGDMCIEDDCPDAAYQVIAPAAQPATETCGTCQGRKTFTRIVGRKRQTMPCPRCKGRGTTPRKEGP